MGGGPRKNRLRVICERNAAKRIGKLGTKDILGVIAIIPNTFAKDEETWGGNIKGINMQMLLSNIGQEL